MNTDLIFVVALGGACVLAGLASLVLYLVAGFRQSVGWGIANLLPLGSLVFTICRWEAAKVPFLLSLFSGVLAFGTVFVANDKLKGGMTLGELPINAAMFEQLAKSVDSSEPTNSADDLARLRDREVMLDEQVRATTSELKVTYADLLAKREALPAGDEEAVREFNQEAAAYSERVRQLAADRAELGSLRKEIREAVDERRDAAESLSGPRVTVYSTSWCGPCKMAKAHLKKRGVPFKEIDVEKSPAGAEEFRKLGGGGVPLIVIDGEKIRGFNAQQIDAILGMS